MTLNQRLQQKLSQREADGNLRQLSLPGPGIDFFSNDYLGLAQNALLHESIAAETGRLADQKNGATGSRLLSGNSEAMVALESFLAQLFRAEASLVFNSGYTANLALVSSLPQRGDTLLYDELSHACIKDGARLSLAGKYAFRHNDLEDLERRLKMAKGEKFIVIESVYSMDGDFAPLADMVNLSEKYGAHLILDEAHSTGVWGTGGNGLACDLGLESRILARVYTFGKAMGVHGACVAGSTTLVSYLVNFARPFIYTTAMPVHAVASIRQAFEFLAGEKGLQQTLLRKIKFFNDLKGRTEMKSVQSESAVQALIIPGNQPVKQLAGQLNANGFNVRPILSPTVKAGSERLRICLHAYNSEQEMEELLYLCQKLQH